MLRILLPRHPAGFRRRRRPRSWHLDEYDQSLSDQLLEGTEGDFDGLFIHVYRDSSGGLPALEHFFSHGVALETPEGCPIDQKRS